MTKKLFLAGIVATFLFVSVAQAQTEDLPDPGILPGSPFYFLKSISEGVGTFFTFGDVAKAERFFAIAEVRVAEARALADKGDVKRAEKATEKYQIGLDKALAKTEKAKTKGKDVDKVLAKIAEATVRHQAVLARVYEKVPEQAKAAIERVMEKSARGHEMALSAISGEKKEEIKARIEIKKKEMKTTFEELRGRGIPIPQMNSKNNDEDMDDDRGFGNGEFGNEKFGGEGDKSRKRRQAK